MPKKIQVGLIFGGRSGEHEVSLASALSVYKALDKSLYDVTMIAINKDGRWLLPDPARLLSQAANPMQIKFSGKEPSVHLSPFPNEAALTSTGSLPRFDVILPVLHGTFGEDGTMQGFLELTGIPYVGSGVLGSALGMDKDLAGRLFSAAGIATVPSLSVRQHEFNADKEATAKKILNTFSFPFFVKPANAGSSVGVHKIKKAADLMAALEDAFSFDLKILVQKGIDARELEVSVLGNEQPRASIVGEIVPSHEFYSYEAKYLDENGAALHIPAKDLSPATIAKVQEWAIRAFQALECRGLARVDFFLDRKTGDLYINEINTIPGFTSISMYPKLWEATGLKYSDLLNELIRLAMENHHRRSALRLSYEAGAKGGS